MRNLRKFFTPWHKKYLEKKPKFERKTKRWCRKKDSDFCKQSKVILGSLEKLSVQIQDELNSENPENNKTLKAKIKQFKNLYKAMLELSKSYIRRWIKGLVLVSIIIIIIRNLFLGFFHVSSGSCEVNLLVGDRVCSSKLAYSFGLKPKRGDLIIFEDSSFKYDEKNKFNYFWQKRVGIPFFGLKKGPDNFVKRIIAVPGDKIEGRVENHRTVVYLNDKRLNETYVNPYPLIALEEKTGFIKFGSIFFLKIPKLLKETIDVVHYSYDPELDFSQQPFYHMHSDEIVLKPGTLIPWLKMPGVPTKDQQGKVVDNFGPIVVPKGKYWVMGDSRRNSKDSRFWGVLDEKFIKGKASFVLYSIDSEEPFWFFDFLKNPVGFWVKTIRWPRVLKFLKSPEVGQ